MSSRMKMFHMWIHCSLHVQTCPMRKTGQLLLVMTPISVLPWCSNGSSFQRWWTQWVLWRNHFLEDSWWHCYILNPSWIILSLESSICKLFSVGIWVNHKLQDKSSLAKKNLTTVKAVKPGPVSNLDQVIHCMHPMWVSFAWRCAHQC